MTLSPPTAIPETDDALDRLNAVERDLLGLLGRGHTAKSIATLRSMSEAAVNERFRSARRKTGIGSSREIARLVVARENRHDFIDLARSAGAPPELRRPEAPRRASPNRWRLPMAAAVLLAAAILAQQTSVPPASSPTRRTGDDSLASQILSRLPPTVDLAALHIEVASGSPDEAWSFEMERTLSRRYHEVPGFDEGVQSLSVTCAATLCEVAGETRAELLSQPLTDLMTQLQTPGHPNPIPGVNQIVHNLSSTVDQPTAFVFVSYWRRRD